MKARNLFFAAVALLLSAGFAKADGMPADPRMVVTDPLCIENCGTALEGTTFNFSSNANGGGFLTFVNVSGVDWTTLLIETGSDPFNVPAADVTCETNAFLSCVSTDLAGGITAIYLSGLNNDNANGIPDNFQFFIGLNDDINQVPNQDPNGSGGWGANRSFSAAANVPSPTTPVPEPATLTLMGAGIATFIAKRRLKRQQANS
jgi:PEP-CTERM motif-containing protein